MKGVAIKGVVLAGGTGSRLASLTGGGNKHLLRLAGRAMVEYPVESLRRAGITDILVVTGVEHVGAFRGVLGPGIEFAVQERAGGIAEALLCAERFSGGDRLCAMLGDNLIGGSLRGPAARFAAQPRGARVLLKRVTDPSRYGVATLSGDGSRIVEIAEKPGRPGSDLAVVGIYFYDECVFDVCRGLTRSARGELEITDVNRAYVARGNLEFELLEGWWVDAGTPESVREAEGRLMGG
jgi:glucose-1-phosphate thymidylyltransferase